MIIKILFTSAVTLHRLWPGLFLVLGLSFCCFWLSFHFILEITGDLLVTYMQNVSDCSITLTLRVYRSILATIMSCQALSPGMAQRVIPLPYITYKDGLFQLC